VINPERYVAIANHLKDCVHCQRELNLLERAAALPVSFQPINLRPDDQIALSLERHRFFAITSATSAPIGEQYVYRAEHARLLISVERLRNQANRRILNGHLALSNALRYQPGTTASILCGSEIIESTLIDPYGCFILDDLPAGIHTLSLRLAGCELIIDSLRI
jgi:hypothetical protein